MVITTEISYCDKFIIRKCRKIFVLCYLCDFFDVEIDEAIPKFDYKSACLAWPQRCKILFISVLYGDKATNNGCCHTTAVFTPQISKFPHQKTPAFTFVLELNTDITWDTQDGRGWKYNSNRNVGLNVSTDMSNIEMWQAIMKEIIEMKTILVGVYSDCTVSVQPVRGEVYIVQLIVPALRVSVPPPVSWATLSVRQDILHSPRLKILNITRYKWTSVWQFKIVMIKVGKYLIIWNLNFLLLITDFHLKRNYHLNVKV